MFTGLVEEMGLIRSVERRGNALVLDVDAARVLDDLAVGDSMAVDGVCQTVVALGDAAFRVEAVGSTLRRTTFGDFTRGRRVNLERPLTLGARLGGHLVQGHVDEVGVVRSIRREGEHVLIEIGYSAELAEATIPHGSITVNGVSLTVNAMPDAETFGVSIIPHTWDHTNLQDLQVGDGVNLEGDMFGKHVQRVLQVWRQRPPDGGPTPAPAAG